MKWLNPTLSFLLVTLGVYFVVGWCLLPQPEFEISEHSRLDRFHLLWSMDWGSNTWGFALGPACGAFSGWLTFRKGNRNSAS
ncbi:MAG: hypothetical protein HZA90_09350 [Verrucomicrobia bacterium]|nr:hypothetical protein [Verrucomicrobiota bacterium]